MTAEDAIALEAMKGGAFETFHNANRRLRDATDTLRRYQSLVSLAAKYTDWKRAGEHWTAGNHRFSEWPSEADIVACLEAVDESRAAIKAACESLEKLGLQIPYAWIK